MKSPLFITRRRISKTGSISSDSSSARSLSNSRLGPSTCKSNLFANKHRHILNEKKSHSEKKAKNLFSPQSSRKQSNVRSLLNQLNNSLANEVSVDKSEQINIAINKQEQFGRRKRLFDPNTHKVEEAFDKDSFLHFEERIVIQAPLKGTSILGNKQQMSALASFNSNNNSHRSIPLGQNQYQVNDSSKMTSYQGSFNKYLSNATENESVNSTQEAIYKHRFKCDPNSLQQYLIGIRNAARS